jgi:hypothetical protein
MGLWVKPQPRTQAPGVMGFCAMGLWAWILGLGLLYGVMGYGSWRIGVDAVPGVWAINGMVSPRHPTLSGIIAIGGRLWGYALTVCAYGIAVYGVRSRANGEL